MASADEIKGRAKEAAEGKVKNAVDKAADRVGEATDWLDDRSGKSR